jgi:hypothetical protein
MKLAFPWQEARYRYSSANRMQHSRTVCQTIDGEKVINNAYIEAYSGDDGSVSFICFTPIGFLCHTTSLRGAKESIDKWLDKAGFKIIEEKYSTFA